MSCRGTWHTDRIYCEDCLAAMQKVADKVEYTKYFSMDRVGEAKMFAGISSDTHEEGIFETIEFGLFEDLRPHVCHHIDFCVMGEDTGDMRKFTFEPDPAVHAAWERRKLEGESKPGLISKIIGRL